MKLKERIFLDNYYKKLKDLLNLNESKIDLLISVKQKILQAKKRNKK